MKKSLASLALMVIPFLFIQMPSVMAQDERQLDGFLYPPLPPSGQERTWNGEETDPLWNNIPFDSLSLDPVRTPDRKILFLGSLGNSLLEGMNQGESQFSEEDKDALLMGEPQDHSYVMGLRYSFSEFDLGHFYESIRSFMGSGNSRTARKDQGFSFYVDSTAP
jgi:hypothetical protein